MILAGGLNPENIREAIEAVAPNAVDINSGVEAAPGVKDHEKIHAVIAAVRSIQLKPGTDIMAEKRREVSRIFIHSSAT